MMYAQQSTVKDSIQRLKKILFDQGESSEYICGYFDTVLKDIIGNIETSTCLDKVETLIQNHINFRLKNQKNDPWFIQHSNYAD
jgi:hypothetical protein